MEKLRSRVIASVVKGPKLARDAAPGEALRVLVYDCADQLLASGKLLQTSAAAEPLHKMRVSIRKILSLFFCFKAILPRKETVAEQRRLKRIFKVLGAVRSLDVLLGMVQRPSSVPAEVAMLKRQRQAALRKAVRMVRSARFRDDIARVLAFVDADHPPAKQPTLDGFIVKVLDKQWRRFRKCGRLSDLPMHEQHQLRLHVKKLRYTCDFFGERVCGKKARHQLERCRKWLDKLQAALGDLNDRAAAQAHVSAELWHDIEAWQAPSHAKLLDRADTAQKKLKAQKRFW